MLLKVVPIICAGLAFFACTQKQVVLPPSGEALEREGKTEQAVVGYREQLARTPTTEIRKLSRLQFRIGECLLALDRSTEAFSAFRRAAELDDTNSMAHLRLGQLYMQAGETEQSSEEALIVLRQAGPNPEALGLIASAASANGNLEIARYFFERAQSLAPAETRFSLALAEVYDRMGEGAKARAVLNDAAKLRPSTAAPWLALGRIEESDGQVDAAEQNYRRAVEVEDSPEANLRMAQFLERSSQPEAAERVFSKVDRMRPQLPVSLADYEFRTGQTELAASHYRAAWSPHEEAWRGSSLIALVQRTLLQKKRGDGSPIVARLIEAELETAVAQRSARDIAAVGERLERLRRELDAATVEILRAEIALAQDDIENADLASTAALQRAPESASAHYVAGVVLEREGNSSAARVEWETALEKDSEFIPARVVLAEAELQDGNFAAAKKLTIAALRIEPGNRRALVAFARACVGLREIDAARAISARLQALVPNAPETNLVAAEIEETDSNSGRALELYEAALAIDPGMSGAVEGLTRIYGGTKRHFGIDRAMARIESDSVDIAKASPSSVRLSAARLEALGRAFAQQGRGNDAERCLRRSLALDPSRTEAAEWLTRLQAQRGDEESAKASAFHIQRLYPMLAALSAEEKEQWSSAIGLYEAAIHRGDPTGFVANNLAWLYAQRGGNLDRALTLANRAMQLRPADPAIADTLGYVFLRRREYSHAVAALERAQELMPDANVGDSIKRHLAEAYLRAGDSDRAATLLAQFR